MKRTISSGLAAVVLVALAGCSSSAPKQAPVETVTLPAAPSQAAPTCIPVSSAMGQSIMSKATPGSGARFTKAVAVKSPDFARVYFIALEFTAGGVENQVAVFASSELTPVGAPIMAVDGVAQQVTDWPDADKSKAAISKSDPYVTAAKACLK
jgi:hypothetical protein